ncbi:hypothetical protein [Actinorugispora endophytica]|nr:hypothetical protein [Actinorugispora endophytica]
MPPATRFTAVYAAMTAAHHVGDYLLQTDHQADHKAASRDRADGTAVSEVESWAANQTHVAGYHAAQLAFVALAAKSLGLRLSPGRLAAGVAFSWITHSVIDRRWPVRLWMTRTGSSGFYQVGGAAHADQAMHHAALFAAALLASGGDR